MSIWCFGVFVECYVMLWEWIRTPNEYDLRGEWVGDTLGKLWSTLPYWPFETRVSFPHFSVNDWFGRLFLLQFYFGLTKNGFQWLCSLNRWYSYVKMREIVWVKMICDVNGKTICIVDFMVIRSIYTISDNKLWTIGIRNFWYVYIGKHLRWECRNQFG